MAILTDHHLQWTALLVMMLALFGYSFVKPNFGALPAIFFYYTACSALWVWIFEKNRYVTINPYDQLALRHFAADSIGKFLMVTVPLAFYLVKNKLRYFHSGIVLLFSFSVVNSISLIAQSIMTNCLSTHGCGGIVGNPSMSVGLMVAGLPIFPFIWPFFILVGAAVILSKSSVGVGMFGLYCLYQIYKKTKSAMVPFFTSLIIAGGAYVYLGKELLNTSNRLLIWNYMLGYWAQWRNIPTGTGWGTYHVFSVNLQIHTKLFEGYWWNTMHNDWLQILFETGVLGLVLAIIVYLISLFRTWNRGEFDVFFSLFLYGIFMFMNPALRFPYPLLFGAWIFLYAMKLESLQGKKLTT